MIDICCKELRKIGLAFNASKSSALRVGKRWFEKCSDLVTEWGIVAWSNEVKYLGLNIKRDKRFKLNLDPLKIKFYASFNAMYSRLGQLADPGVAIHLLESIALPAMTYALEAVTLNKSELNSLENTLYKALCKIFKSSDKNVINYCMEMYGLKNISTLLSNKIDNYLNKIPKTDNIILSIIFK